MDKNDLSSIIENLRDLGVDTAAVLACNPTLVQLRDMRDGLLILHDAAKVVMKYRNMESKSVPIFMRE